MTTNKHAEIYEKIYSQLDEDYEGRACRDISDKACVAVPKNFVLMALAQVASKTADVLVSAKIVLPWLVQLTGTPLFFIGLLVPIRESGSMLPQLFLGERIRRLSRRKYALALGALIQGIAISGLILVVWFLSGITAGIAILLLLTVFSLARSISSIASKDVVGKTIPKNRRGAQSGLSASIAGLLTVVFGAVLVAGIINDQRFDIVILLAAILFVICAALYCLLSEYDGETGGGKNGFSEAISTLSIAFKEAAFVRFVSVRALLLSSALCSPYIVLLTTASDASSLRVIGYFIIISGAASAISGKVWGSLADNNAKAVLTITALLTLVICVAGCTLSLLSQSDALSLSAPAYRYAPYGLFFLLAIVHEGVRQGRKIYVIDLADGDKRTQYVSVSNTVIGFLLLIVGLISGLIGQASITYVLAFFAVLAGIAFGLSFGLKSLE